MAHQPAMRPSDAVAIAGKPFMDEPVGGNSSARVPVNLVGVGEFLSLLGYLLCSALTSPDRWISDTAAPVCVLIVLDVLVAVVQSI